MRTTTFTLAATAALVVAGAAVGPAAVASPRTAPAPADTAATPVAGAYTALAPTRILDTRDGTGGQKAPLTHGVARALQVGGRAGVPASGVSSVVLNVTVTNPTTSGYLSVYAGNGSPATSNLNFVAGQTVANLVSVRLPASGLVTAYYGGGTGTTDVIADVSGWFADGDEASPGAFVPLTASRLLDTRNTTPVSPAVDRVVPVGGQQGVPSNAGAVVLNVTVTDTTTAGFVTVYPGGTRPIASNLNYVAGQTVPNLVAVPLSQAGSISLGVGGSKAPADLVIDVFGYYIGGAPTTTGMFGALSPARLLDTRSGVGAPTGRVAGISTVALKVLGRGGVPATGVGAVVLNVTAVNPLSVGYFTVYGPGSKPLASNLNFSAGTVVPNLVIVPIADNGTISIFNGSGTSTDIIADVTGYVRAPSTASISRYVNDLTGSQTDAQITSAMRADGQADGLATTGSGQRLTILEFGAQSNKAGGDGTGNGSALGVRLPAIADPGMRLTYDQMQTAVDGYLDGFMAAAPTTALTLALGTNSAGYSGATYSPSNKGTDWASQVRTAAGYAKEQNYGNVTVVGANDIEAVFDATASQVTTWIGAYRAGGNAPALVNNGAAINCPTAVGAVNQSCGAVQVEETDPPVFNTWTQADYVSFSVGTGITIAPQIYFSTQAAQWENVLLSSGGNSIRFSGIMTQVGACGRVGGNCSSLTPKLAQAAMNTALDSNPATASLVIPTVTDIRYP